MASSTAKHNEQLETYFPHYSWPGMSTRVEEPLTLHLC